MPEATVPELEPAQLIALVDAALDARDRSYAPYSDFRAGAAVLTDDGRIVTGSIVENISLGLAMCAERVAMFAAVTGTDPTPRLRALVLAAPDTGPRLTWPCGACRQVALELGGEDVQVASVGADRGRTTADRGMIELRPLGELLPDAPHRRRD